jgi:FtsP/CotA-like multicopper oxidase with cupredoxin domain
MKTGRLHAFLLSLALALPVPALEPSIVTTTPAGQGGKKLMQVLSQAVVDLKDGDRYLLRAQPVTKTIAGVPVRLYAYNGSVPGPLLRVRQGSTVTIDLVNALDQETDMDWNGVLADNMQDSELGRVEVILAAGRHPTSGESPSPRALEPAIQKQNFRPSGSAGVPAGQ